MASAIPVLLGVSAAMLAAVSARAQILGETARPLRPAAGNTTGWRAEGKHEAVSAGGAEAVDAGMRILAAGGNAADAAVATILALSVTDAHLFCFGGEVPLLVYNAQRGVTEVIAGQGAAPALATRDHFAPAGPMPTSGIEVAAVPAVLDACLVTLERHGTLRFREVAQPALELLDRKQERWHADLRATIDRLIEAENQETDRLLGYRRVSDRFYRGDIAREIDAWSRANGGLLRFSDLARHATPVEAPVSINFLGYTILKCGPWTQGPVLLQALQLLDPLPLGGEGGPQAGPIHVAVEALKLALADRDQYYADPNFAQVPLEQLLAPRYADLRRSLILPRASTELQPGDPIGLVAAIRPTPALVPPPSRPNDTTTCLVCDRWGNVVAATPSGWSGTLAGSTGVWLGSRLQSFRIESGHPNVIEPGKRPRITLSPTLILKQGKPLMAVSVAGGDLQDQVSLQLILNRLVTNQTAAEAVTSPRFSTGHHIGSFAQTPPALGSLTLNADMPEAVVDQLRQKGHQVTLTPDAIGAPSILVLDPGQGVAGVQAAGDPRAGRHAAAR